MPLMPADWLKYLQIVGVLHTLSPREKPNATRKWDGKTPYMVHPIWCACTIAFEQKLPMVLRTKGALTLLFHDILEDTQGILPEELPGDVVSSIMYLTSDGTGNEWDKIWRLQPEIRLFKLYDKVCNLMDCYDFDPERVEHNIQITRKLVADVEKNYGTLNITIIARALLKKLEDSPPSSSVAQT